jgi:hypothetical protein
MNQASDLNLNMGMSGVNRPNMTNGNPNSHAGKNPSQVSTGKGRSGDKGNFQSQNQVMLKRDQSESLLRAGNDPASNNFIIDYSKGYASQQQKAQQFQQQQQMYNQKHFSKEFNNGNILPGSKDGSQVGGGEEQDWESNRNISNKLGVSHRSQAVEGNDKFLSEFESFAQKSNLNEEIKQQLNPGLPRSGSKHKKSSSGTPNMSGIILNQKKSNRNP